MILDIHRVFKYKVNQKQKFDTLESFVNFDCSNSVYLLHLSSNKHKCFIYYFLRTHLSIRSINMSNSSLSGSEQEVDATPFHPKKNQNKSNKAPIKTLTDKDSEWYNLSGGKKLAIIFNHEYFKNGMSQRRGTDKDCKAIKTTFEKLGFEVQQHDDLTNDKLTKELDKIGKQKNLSCLALFILTHGEKHGTIYTYDDELNLNKDIIDRILPTKCEQLAGKPKFIFVQACAGDETDAGSVVYGSAPQPECFQVNTPRGKANDEPAIYCIPNYADLLVFQASYKGHFAFRSASGSWFIQKVCEVIDESGDHEDLASVLTRAARKISQRKSNTNVPSLDQKMQMPMKQDTLIR